MSRNRNVEEESNQGEIKVLLDDMEKASIGFENFKFYHNKVTNHDVIIKSQIGNLVRDYTSLKEELDKLVSRDSYKGLEEDGYVLKGAFDIRGQMLDKLKEAYSWKVLQEEMYSILSIKMYQVMDDAKSLDIKRDVLTEMREIEEKRHQMFIEIMKNMGNMFKDDVSKRLNNQDEKLIKLIMNNDEEHRRDRKDILSSMKDIIDNINIKEEDKKRIITDMGNYGSSKPKSKPKKYIRAEELDDDDDDDSYEDPSYIFKHPKPKTKKEREERSNDIMEYRERNPKFELLRVHVNLKGRVITDIEIGNTKDDEVAKIMGKDFKKSDYPSYIIIRKETFDDVYARINFINNFKGKVYSYRD